MRSIDQVLFLALAAGCARPETYGERPAVAPASSASASAVMTATAAPTESSTASPPTPSATTTATTPIGTVRPNCERRGYVAPAGAKPTIRAVSQGALVNVTFVNEGTEPVCLLAHVESQGAQFDWITASLSGGPGPTRNLIFVDDRDKSARYSVELGPNGRYTETIDLGAWAKRRVNGGRALTAGGWVVTLDYVTSHETTAWSGVLRTTTNVVIPVDKASVLTTP